MFVVLFSLLAFGFAAPIESGDSSIEVIPAPKEESIYEQVLQLVEPKLREHMLNQGIPEGAVEEFFKSGFLYPPHDKKKLNEMVQWAKKWTKKHAEKQEKLNFDELQKFQIRITDEVSTVFGNLYAASVKLACISKAKSFNLEDIMEFKEALNKLSPLEKDLFEGVIEHMQMKLIIEMHKEKFNHVE
ncbi:hypothetical protein PFISCL1PPCAC_27701 [Pristionchus fissidentatus]|uniref:SXP/RAL-2 family protein Ani s 5-like cation-binding domain-containing protein n=1 Tax=Pristionchus fissidentatus TaxID=1538716 RepID=A0AAV5X0B6_9BILA|nr:hypothetical protein PFISCL1PPCAC_27701 [Pristionchus fissidentatus]